MVGQSSRCLVDCADWCYPDPALNALRDITIQLQQSMLRELSKALEDDNMQDFTAVVDASDTARLRTINVLNDLFLRMQAEAYRDRSLSPASSGQNHIQPRATDIPLPQKQIESSRAPPRDRVYTLPDDSESGTSQKPYLSLPASVPKKARRGKGPSYIPGLSELFPRRTKSGHKSAVASRGIRLVDQEVQPTVQSLPTDFGRPQQGCQAPGLLDSVSLTGNPWANSMDSTMQVRPTEMDKLHRRHTNHDQLQQMTSSPASANSPTPQDFQGFCKGAYYLQVHLKSDGMKLRNMSGSFTGERFYYACSNSKCCFEAPACKIGKVWNVVDTVYGHKNAVNFRWSLLAKSHIQQSKVKLRNFQYRCVFCAIQNREARVFDGANSLIEHVAQHRTEPPQTEGRVVVDGKDFDIQYVVNDVPVDTASLGSRLSTSTIQEGSSWSLSDDGNPWERP